MGLKLVAIPTTRSERLETFRKQNANQIILMGDHLRFNKTMLNKFHINSNVHMSIHMEPLADGEPEFNQNRTFYLKVHVKKVPESIKLAEAPGNARGTMLIKVPPNASKFGMRCTPNEIVRYKVENEKASGDRVLKLSFLSSERKRFNGQKFVKNESAAQTV